MPLRRTACLGLLLLTSLVSVVGQADELRDIQQLAKQDQPDAALRRINTYLNANPQNLQGWFIKGLILAQEERTEEAIKIFTDITRNNPSLPEPYNNLAVLYASQGEYDQAKRALEAALNTNPSYATAHENLGDIYAHMASEAYDRPCNSTSATLAHNRPSSR
jgi:tetratricopeptide (TPR) repeat protein